eukprot:10157972-Lingulodinium_polyedra.AAC.1
MRSSPWHSLVLERLPRFLRFATAHYDGKEEVVVGVCFGVAFQGCRVLRKEGRVEVRRRAGLPPV